MSKLTENDIIRRKALIYSTYKYLKANGMSTAEINARHFFVRPATEEEIRTNNPKKDTPEGTIICRSEDIGYTEVVLSEPDNESVPQKAVIKDVVKETPKIPERKEIIPKYAITNIKKCIDGIQAFRIKALRDIPEIGVEKGDLGGYVQRDDNLSQEGSCWVFDDAVVYGYAEVSENARIYDRVSVSGQAEIKGRAIISEKADIHGKCLIEGSAVIQGRSEICDNAYITDRATVVDGKVSDRAKLCDDAYVENGIVNGSAILKGNSFVKPDAIVSYGEYDDYCAYDRETYLE